MMAGSAKLANAGVRMQAHSVTGARREVRAPREVRTPDAPLRANMANKERAIDEKRAPNCPPPFFRAQKWWDVVCV